MTDEIKNIVTMTTYIKVGMELNKVEDIEKILQECESGNIVIFNVASLVAFQKIQQLNYLIDKLVSEAKIRGFETARLGTFRGIVCPIFIKVWRWE